MLYNSPIITLLLLVICLTLLIKKCISERKFYKELLSINLILIFSYAMIIVFYENITSSKIGYNVYIYSTIGILLAIAFFLFFITNNNINKRAFLNNILYSLEDNTYYLLLNKKNKIIEISKYLADKLNVNKEEVIGKPLEYILNEYITIEKINSKSVSNNEFLLYLSTTIPQELNSNLEITFLNKEGKEDSITITESPIYTGDKYYGRMYLGVVKPKEEVVKETIDDKFNELLKISNEGIFSYDFITSTFKINDILVKTLNLVGNIIQLSDILYNIKEDDFNHLKEQIHNTTRDNNYIKTTLEYKLKDGTKVFLKTNISIIFDGLNKINAVGSVLVNNSNQFITLNSSVLDNMRLEDNIIPDIKTLSALETKFEVVTFKILGIKEINNTYSRQIGTLIIEEYVRSIINAFEINDFIYRVSGTRFTFILTDPRHMEKLTRALTNNKLLTPSLNYGHLNIKLNVIMGVSFSNDSIRKEEIYTNSKYALKKCMEQKEQYLFYRDLLE